MSWKNLMMRPAWRTQHRRLADPREKDERLSFATNLEANQNGSSSGTEIANFTSCVGDAGSLANLLPGSPPQRVCHGYLRRPWRTIGSTRGRKRTATGLRQAEKHRETVASKDVFEAENHLPVFKDLK